MRKFATVFSPAAVILTHPGAESLLLLCFSQFITFPSGVLADRHMVQLLFVFFFFSPF